MSQPLSVVASDDEHTATPPRAGIAGPVVRPTLAGKTHYLRVESFDPQEVANATHTLCNTPRGGAPVMTIPGVQVTCKRCLKLDELNARR